MANTFSRTIINSIKAVIISILRGILKGIPADDQETLLAGSLEKNKNSFMTYHFRPKEAADVDTWSDKTVDQSKIGIVIQGPLIKEDHFTLETVKIYKKLLSHSVIIVSTWSDEDEDYIKQIRDLDVEVILNEKPSQPGISHINYQIVSSYAGIHRLNELRVDYALKTRSDQRVYAPNIESYLCGILETFPPSGGFKLKRRIVGLSLNSYKYRLYGISDMFVFGTIKDMLTYWGCELDTRDTVPPQAETNVLEYAKARLCEVYLSAHFLQSIGYDFKWTLKDSWRAYAEVFCIIDKESVDLFWQKYSRYEYRRLEYDSIRTNRELVFREWLILYNSYNNVQVDEKSVLHPFGEKIC